MTIRGSSMREPTYFLLVALMDGPLHGYAIIKCVAELSAGRVRLAAGTLYAALDRLTGDGLVEVVREETVGGRARRYYALTSDGAAALDAEAARLTQAARLVIEHRAARADQAAEGSRTGTGPVTGPATGRRPAPGVAPA